MTGLESKLCIIYEQVKYNISSSTVGTIQTVTIRLNDDISTNHLEIVDLNYNVAKYKAKQR